MLKNKIELSERMESSVTSDNFMTDIYTTIVIEDSGELEIEMPVSKARELCCQMLKTLMNSRDGFVFSVDMLNEIIADMKNKGINIRDSADMEYGISEVAYEEEIDEVVAKFEDVGEVPYEAIRN